jgi:hypothetical protein
MSVHSIHMHYPTLRQIWTNHVLPFLCPNQFHWRKQMPIIHHEMDVMVNVCSHNRIGCSSCRHPYRHGSVWLEPHVVVHKSMVLHNLETKYVYMVFHVSDNGVLHCTNINTSSNARSFARRNTFIDLRFDVPMYYDMNTWTRMYQPHRESECVCLHRALVLQSIRNRWT